MDIILCLASAVFSGLAFITENTWPLVFIAPSLFFLSLKNGERSFSKGFLFGFFFYLINSIFISSLNLSHLSESSLFRKLFPSLAYILVIFLEGIFAGVFAKAYSLISSKINKKMTPLVFSALWVIYEYILAYPATPLGYPWGRICLPLASFPFLIQTASIFGMLFISFLIIYFSSSLAMSIDEKNIKYIISPVALLLANIICCSFLYFSPEDGIKIRVKCVQNGYGAFEKWVAPPSSIIEKSIEEFSGDDLILFAESAVPMYLNKSTFYNKLNNAAKENDVTVLIGALYEKDDDTKFTSVYLFPAEVEKVFHKRHLVPYGEYYPLLNLFSKELAEAGFSMGDSSLPLKTDSLSLGPVICFDSMFPSYSRETVKNGAEILCVSTNDSWFSKGRSAYLHLCHSVYRAVENKRFVARSASTGISAVIDSKGNILSYLDIGKEGSLTEDAILKDNITLYTRFGDLPMIIFCLSVIFLSLFKRRNKNA